MHLEAGIDEMAKRELLRIKTESKERKSKDVYSIRARTVMGSLCSGRVISVV